MTADEAFAALGLSPSATTEQLKEAFRRKASRLHPDRFVTPGERAVATQRFQRIAEAYEMLQRQAPARRREQSGTRAKYEPATPVEESLPDAWDLLADLKERAPLLHLLFELLWVFTLLPTSMMSGVLLFAEPAGIPFRVVSALNTLVVKVLAPLATIGLGFYGLERTSWSIVLVVAGVAQLALEVVAQIIGVLRLKKDKPRLALVLSRLPEDER